MQSSEVISKLVQFGDCTKEVYVTIFTRNSDGDVIGKKQYPISEVFSHCDNRAEIYLEESESSEIL